MYMGYTFEEKDSSLKKVLVLCSLGGGCVGVATLRPVFYCVLS